MPQDSNSYAETVVTLFGLAALALGTVAMFVRFLLRRGRTLRTAGRQMVADVRKGEGFTFHRELVGAGSAANGSRSNETQRPATTHHGNGQTTPQPPRVLRLREWLNLVNHHPDAVPHLFIEGGSGAGKTTLALAILGDRPGPIAIVGVKPDDQWTQAAEGYTYRSNEREPKLAALLDDVRRRLDDGDKSGLTIVLDDFTRLASDHPAAVQLYKLVADVGRSLRIRLILIARGRQVKGIGASGESDLLDHFVFITVQRGHRATLEYDEEAHPLDTERVSELARPLPGARLWQPATRRESDERTHLLSLLERPPARPVSSMQRPGDQESASTPGTTDDTAPDTGEETEGIPAKLTPEAIQTLYSAWGSKNKIAEMLTGKKQKRLAIIDAALEEETTQTTR